MVYDKFFQQRSLGVFSHSIQRPRSRSEQVSEQVSGQVLGQVPEQVPEQVSKQVLEHVPPEHVPAGSGAGWFRAKSFDMF